MSTVLVLPSPLLPASAYRELATALSDRGVEACVAPARLGPDEGADDLVRRWSRLVAADTTLVAHSNAGYLAPLVRATHSGRAPIVFVDAALPPASGSTPLAPPVLRAMLDERVDADGRLPPWTRWWPRATMDAVVPSGAFPQLDRDCPRLPRDYFDAVVDAPSGWTGLPTAYLAFGTTYAEELEQARELGWPHATLDAGHLHFMHDPEAVAAQIEALATAAVAAGGERRS
ncbi:alpha/beta hydrolase [Nostocoides sp. F2B08]|uniref:alpha/beta fold hydrolase n=1 Tax=Nostocoides sp. F2B08 TaxID=2653936 RepID=UPI001263DB1D|nr:alpha/beta fold hydrolase [Tetrasphaera sp. F2B08]KAB7743516.1 alpha/beta hydrolase [Tetrasphaera sp. F2B08]